MLLVLNWKLNPSSFVQAKQLLKITQHLSQKTKRGEIVVCPPFEYLFRFAGEGSLLPKTSFAWGAQDCFWENEGAYTGTISPLGLKKLGVTYVILGHSERRHYLKEDNQLINKKLLSALSLSLTPILCLGETQEKEQQGEKAVRSFLKRQLAQSLVGIEKLSLFQRHHLVLAYEPPWAISNVSGGKTAEPARVASVIGFLKEVLAVNYSLTKVKVLYGGSVRSDSLKEFLGLTEIDGFLIGQASLVPQELKKIVALIG